MSDVFISYSSKNRDVADRIREDLTQLGFKVFYDKELVPGESWAHRLAQELNRAKYILVLLSPSYVKSQGAARELEVAALSEAEGRARIIPILIQDTEIPPFLRDKFYADLREDYETGLALVKKALTIAPRPSDESQARRKGKLIEIMGVLFSLLGAALSSTTVVWRNLLKGDSSVVIIVIGAVAGLTTLVMVISFYRSHRRTGPIEVVARALEQVYVGALEESNLNPIRVREVKHDR
jgi:hypothetical protein